MYARTCAHLSTQAQPLALAEFVHALFCDFDFALSNTQLFKVSLSLPPSLPPSPSLFLSFSHTC